MDCRRVITICLWNRPDYTRRCLDALRECRGIANYLILPHVEPGNEAVRAQVESIDFAESLPTMNRARLGVNGNTENALLDGFAFSGFVIHVEDDIVLARDALTFFEWSGARYADDARVFSVTGYNRLADPAPPGDYHRVRLRRWFHPWGWATWRDRWETFSGTLHASRTSWDVRLNAAHCSGGTTPRCLEAYPELSRSQNIGLVSSLGGRDVEWYREHHHLRHWAGDVDVPSRPFSD